LIIKNPFEEGMAFNDYLYGCSYSLTNTCGETNMYCEKLLKMNYRLYVQRHNIIPDNHIKFAKDEFKAMLELVGEEDD
jgi:hypothetical protein